MDLSGLSAAYLRLRYRRHRFGPGFRGPMRLRIRGKGVVSFGHDVHIRNDSGRTAILTFNADARIEVGDRVQMDGAGLMSASRIIIDADAILGPCLLVDTDFHTVVGSRRETSEIAARRPIRVGRHALIEGKATVLKGVSIGDGALVRWASVVASDVPAGAVVIGNPATVV